MGLKQLLRKLRTSVWQKPLKGQRKAIHGMSQQITQLLAVTEANKYNEGDNLSMEEKMQIEDDIESAFEGINLDAVDVEKFADFMSDY